ncbi:protein jag [Plantactinospora sp. KLBMP9567]|uniref:Jag family protein n=1 Tax=Plantactinospora sp. KLBMP9567 TaxID=3085900 RepID=UPI00298238C9|nr:R3H domain-containing nucleic acid-binding protein [Plantactinospora sp. KLBMP9567]MDW5328481.1 R3H domain-containing nucleic acid-binding protein [Plantactinospora sp. KLBMP9567]
MTDTSIPRAEQPIGDTDPVLPAGSPADAETTEAVAVAGDVADAGPGQDDDVDDMDDDEEGDEEGDEVEQASNGGKPAGPTSDADLFRQSEIAADYVEGLLDILDYDGDIDELVSAGRPVVEVVGGRLQALVGQRGATLEALQELTRLAVFRQTGSPSRLLLDVGGYRATRRKELSAVAKNAVEKVKQHGEAVRLEPMSAFERKCVHDVVNAIAGVESESEGVEPNRRIVVRPVD